jgi:hypothetical protein
MKINEKTLRALEQIAMESDYNLETRGGLETRNNDEEDFPEISVWGLRKMLEHAYLLGRMDAEKGRV